MQAVILAAGESTRFWPLNHRHKSLFKIMGKPLILYLLEGLKRAGLNEAIIVQGPKRDVETELENYSFLGLKIRYAVQKKPTGTGDAILSADKLIKDRFFVLNAERADCEFHIRPILEKTNRIKDSAVLLAGPTNTPWLFGILKVKGEKIVDLVEKPKPGKEPSNLKVVGTYFFPKKFLSYLKKIPSHPYSLEKAIALFAQKEEAKIALFDKKTFALKFPWDLFNIRDFLFNRFLKSKIEGSANIAKNALIEGNIYIGNNVKIFENAVIKGPCYIGDNCTVGNNSLVRKYVNLEENVLIGGFAEVKSSIFQTGCSVHSGFFGDSIFDKNCWMGAGVVTANKHFDKKEVKSVIKGEKIDTGLMALGAIVGKNAKIGINTSLMPGVLIGENAVIGPHSLVRENIPDNKIFYTKATKVINAI